MNNISMEGRFNDLDKIQKSLTKDLKGVGYRPLIYKLNFWLPIRNREYYSLPTAYQLFFGPYYNLYRVNKYGFKPFSIGI